MRTTAGAGDRARWAAGRTRAGVLSPYFGGVTPSRVRHDRAEERGPVIAFFRMLEDPQVDGPALIVGAQESLEARFLAENDVKVLRGRLGHLVHTQIHDGHSKLVRALLDPESTSINDRLRSQAARLVEASAIRAALRVEE